MRQGDPRRGIVLCLAAFLCSSAAAASDTVALGGPGGVPYRLQCPPGELLVGLTGYGGSWLDSIQPICAGLARRGSYNLERPVVMQQTAGGRGGNRLPARTCPNRTAVSSIQFGTPIREGSIVVRDDLWYVTDLHFRCAPLADPAAQGRPFVVLSGDHWVRGRRGRGIDWYRPIRCPAGELAIGIHGKAGSHVDSMGLICGPPPAIDVPSLVTRMPLKLFWSSQRNDNFSSATPEGEQSAAGAGYGLVRIEGHVLSAQQRGMVPLRLFWHPERADNFTTATTVGIRSAQDAGYQFVRVEGYVYRNRRPGTVPLKLFWSDARSDNFTTATAEGEQAALSAGYRFVRVEGYVFPP